MKHKIHMSRPNDLTVCAQYAKSCDTCAYEFFFKGGVMIIKRYETTDIFIGAFFLCKGGDLCGIRIKDAARGIAAFEISGTDLDRLGREYRSGKALVNPVQLRDSLNLLRDMLFDLRDTRRKNDRKRKNRGIKA
jgi:hypothetical protein